MGNEGRWCTYNPLLLFFFFLQSKKTKNLVRASRDSQLFRKDPTNVKCSTAGWRPGVFLALDVDRLSVDDCRERGYSAANLVPNVPHSEHKRWSLLSQAFTANLGNNHKCRVLKVLPLVQEILSRITEGQDVSSLTKAFEQIFYCM